MVSALVFTVLLPAAQADGFSDCTDSCSTDFDTCLDEAEDVRDRECDPLQWSGSSWRQGQQLKDSCKHQLMADTITPCATMLSTCVELCTEAYSDSGGTGGAGMTLDDCPAGTRPSPLGTCLPDFGQAPEDVDPDDGCPAGYELGPAGGCVPAIELVPADVVGHIDGTGFLVCPDGMVPGPVGGCVVDTFDPTTEVEQCPPGFVGGPDGQCVPGRGTTLGRTVLGIAVRGMLAVGTDMDAAAELLDGWGVVPVEDVEAAVVEVEQAWMESDMGW